MARKLHTTLLSAIAWATFGNAAPADPTITTPAILPRQADAAFIGWVSYSGVWWSQTCESGLTWYQSGEYGQCCPDTLTGCPAPTACVGGSQIYPFASTTITTACTGNYNDTALSICNTAFIFQSFGDSKPKTDIICGDSSVNWSYYRQIPATATETSSQLPSSASSLVKSSGTPQPQAGKSKSKSKAWIAGAVVGPIVGIALIAGIVFFFMRRRKNKNAIPQTGGATMGGPPPGVRGSYTDAKPQPPPDPTYGPAGGYYAQQPLLDNTHRRDSTYPQDYKDHYAHQGQPPVAELGGASSPAAGQSHAAEMPAESARK